MTAPLRAPIPTALFASGRGSNARALHTHAVRRDPPLWRPVLVLSDRSDAPVLEWARSEGLDARVIDPAAGPELRRILEDADVGMVLLAGYLRLVPPAVVEGFRGRILNIHPALLPAFGGRGMYGRRVHEAVLASGEQQTGVTVHLVDEDYDRGSILAQRPVPVRPDDDPDTLGARVLEVEHHLYPRMADHLARALLEGRPARPLNSQDSTHASP